jgi:REP element-mobilizing transposase RayT
MPRVRHYFEAGQFAHITSRTEGAKFLLATDAAKAVILGSIHTYERKGFYRLLAYVIMNNHFHFVAVVRKSEGFGAAIGRLKGWTSREIEKITGAPRPVWERRFDDNAILTEEELYAVVDYIHNNPVRAGIVKRAIDYPWSSARKWAEEGPSRL